MNVYVLDEDFQALQVVDDYISLIWTLRYYTPGDFELYTMATPEKVALYQPGRYMVREADAENGIYKHVMIITNVTLTTNVEEGDTLTITGQDLKAILHRRVVQDQTSSIAQTIQAVIRTWITENIINPSDSARQIPNFELGTDQISTATSITKQVTGTNLGEAIEELCQEYGIGYDVYIDSGSFVFYLYEGADRSLNQSTYTPVIFSESFDNLLATEYTEDRSLYANVAVVAGEGEGTARQKYVAGDSTAEGLSRYEIWVDARDVSSNEGEISQATIEEMLNQQGLEALAEQAITITFEGEIGDGINYSFGTDYFLGDTVQIMSSYGVSLPTRVAEIIMSDGTDGSQMIPTFTYQGGE